MSKVRKNFRLSERTLKEMELLKELFGYKTDTELIEKCIGVMALDYLSRDQHAELYKERN